MPQHEDNGAVAIGKFPCPSCGSRDNLVRYSDGHAYCFGCTHYEHGDKIEDDSGDFVASEVKTPERKALADGEIVALEKRKIFEETCAKWNYRVGKHKGKTVQIANYCDSNGHVVAQKIRGADKSFTTLGSLKEAMPLYGQWLWRETGKKVVVTEGELDALSVSQAQGNKWPVVSVPSGSASAKGSFKKAIEWLERFDEVVIMFDMDTPGQDAARECAKLLSPGKAKIAQLPLKDASDMLQAGRTKELIDAIWGARTYRPDGIINGADLWERIRENKVVDHADYPWPLLNGITKGMRYREIVTWTAGSGIGKSTIVAEIMTSIFNSRTENVAYIALEESAEDTAKRFMSHQMNKPLHLTRDGISDDDLKQGFDATLGSGRFFFYDHFGENDSTELMNKIRYLAVACDCKWFVLDHISIVVSGMDDDDNERKTIDNLMTKLRKLVEELDISMAIVSHLTRPKGEKGHEDGAQITLKQLRGSHAIVQLSNLVIGAERDTQGDDEEKNILQLRVLKNRFTGVTGLADKLEYDPLSGRLKDVTTFFNSDEA